MAILFTNRGGHVDTTSGTTTSFSPASDLASGSWAVVAVAVDNSNTDGAAHSSFTVTDSHGNAWTRRTSPLYDTGAADEGVEGGIFTTNMDAGVLTTGSTITVTVGTAVLCMAARLVEASPDAGRTLVYVTGANNAGAATNTPTITTASVLMNDGIVCALFNEYGSAQTVTGDADTTNGSWSAVQSAEAGTTTSGVTAALQTKVVTATATQTFNPTLGTSSDVILSYIELAEVASGSPVRGLKYQFSTGLVSQASTMVLQSNPTIAAGDFKVSIDNGALANLTSLPAVTPASSKMVNFLLTESEMSGSDITVVCSDAAGAEWCDQIINLKPTRRGIDDLAYPSIPASPLNIDENGSITIQAGTDTGQLDFTSGVVKGNLVSILGTALTETAGQIAGAFKKWFDVGTPTGTVNSIPGAVAGASGGLFIAGTNAPVTITGSGNALTLTSTGGGGSGLSASGNTTGHGIISLGGNAGHGITAYTGGANCVGFRAEGAGSGGYGVNFVGGGYGAQFQTGAGGVAGLYVTSADGTAARFRSLGGNGNGLLLEANGSGVALSAANIPSAVPGAANGIFIAGANAATTVDGDALPGGGGGGGESTPGT